MTEALRRPGAAQKPPTERSSPGDPGGKPPARSGAAFSRAEGLTPEEREALAWTHTARFFTTAAQLPQLPGHDLPEIAFVGRSNAGKSTAINTVAHQRQLAYASKTPGRTQHINLFAVGPRDAPQVLWADLPGYGYAAVAKASKERWQQVMADYLAVRRNLAGVVQMVDARHGFTPLDLQLLDFVAPRVRTGEVRLLVLLTKADKLNRKESTAALQAAHEALGEYSSETADIGVALFSALKGIGVADAAVVLKAWAEPRGSGTAGPAAPAEGATPEGGNVSAEVDASPPPPDAAGPAGS